jgi:tetratricopeptide (TPR) repeat protein
VTELPIEQQAKLAYATRQFDVAQDLYEQMLAGGSLSANDLNFGGHLDDYLELTLRVRLDVDRPIVALERFSKRDDLTPVLREEVAAWIVDLRAAASREPGPPLAIARVLVTEQGKDVETERHALVRHLEASGLLHRTLGQPHSQAERAEAYYLLGLIETRIGRSYWLSQAEAYLETAIRLAPGEDTAADAYALLDEFLVAGYSGSGGTHVPPDIQAKLDQLRAIAESAPEA